jgi:hypothetical protein
MPHLTSIPLLTPRFASLIVVPGMNVGAGKWESNPSSDDENGLEGIKGFVVEAAPLFLEEQNLLPKVGTKAYLMPLHMFV